jgi:hypothetical protein
MMTQTPWSCLLNAQTLAAIPCFAFAGFHGITIEIGPDNQHVAVVAQRTTGRWRQSTRHVTLFVANLLDLTIKAQLDIPFVFTQGNDSIVVAWHPGDNKQLAISNLCAAIDVDITDPTRHQVQPLAHEGKSLSGELLSFRYNHSGQTLTACGSASGELAIYTLEAHTFAVLHVATLHDDWINYIWWCSDSFGAYITTEKFIVFLEQKDNGHVELLRQFCPPNNQYVSSFAFVRLRFAVALERTRECDIWLQDAANDNHVASHRIANAIGMRIQYCERDNVIVAHFLLERYQALRLLDADDLSVLVNADPQSDFRYSQIRPMQNAMVPRSLSSSAKTAHSSHSQTSRGIQRRDTQA